MKKFKAFISITLTVMIFIVVSCKKNPTDVVATNTTESGVVISEIEDAYNSTQRYTDSIKAFLKYDNQYQFIEKCYINEDSSYCVNIVDVVPVRENGVTTIYAIQNGKPLNKNREIATSQTDLGSLKFFKFELRENGIKIIAESDPITCGSFREVCTGATYKLGSGPELGWIVTTEEGSLESGHVKMLNGYAVINKKIQPILNIPIYCLSIYPPNDTENGAQFYAKVTTVPSTTTKFSDLVVVIKEVVPPFKKINFNNISTTLKYDDEINTYNQNPLVKFLSENYIH